MSGRWARHRQGAPGGRLPTRVETLDDLKRAVFMDGVTTRETIVRVLVPTPERDFRGDLAAARRWLFPELTA